MCKKKYGKCATSKIFIHQFKFFGLFRLHSSLPIHIHTSKSICISACMYTYVYESI